MRNLLSDAREEFKNQIKEGNVSSRDYSDSIHEIADSMVPVYNADLLKLASEDNCLATDEPECGPAFDGKATPINIIAANVYERITNYLYAEYETILEEIDEEMEEDINLMQERV